MLNIRYVRLPNAVIRRNILTNGCRSFCSTTTETPTTPRESGRIEEFETLEPETRKNRRFEALPEEGDLTFKIPGLSVREETFVKQQTRIILRPECMKERTEIQEFPVENVEETKYSGFLDRRNFERVFPSSHGMRNMVACHHQIEKVYPKFKVPRRDTDRYGRNLTSPILSQRISEGLHLCGIRDRHLSQNPDLVLSPAPSYVTLCELAELAEVDLSKLENFSRGTMVLRGNFIHNYITSASQALDQLDFPDQARAISQIYFGRLKQVTLHDLYWHCCKPVLVEIARRRDFKFDINTWWKAYEHNKRKTIKSPVHLARNFYIFQKVLDQSNQTKRATDGTTLFRDFTVPEPLETLITLNCYYETLSDLDPNMKSKQTFLDAFVRGAMYTVRTPPYNLPVSVRRQILSDIGFTSAEVANILMSPKCCRFTDKSTNLLYTLPEFVPTMKERLTLLRTESHKLGLSDPEQLWGVLTNWASVMQDLAYILDNKETGVIKATFSKTVEISLSTNENLPWKKRSHPAIKFLSNYFGYTSKSDISQLLQSTFPTICFPSVPLGRIHENLDRLITRGFTKEQIRSATPLLCFPPSLVVQTLDEIESKPESESRDVLLQICLYYIEREFNFSSDGLFTTSQKTFFSDKLQDEVSKYRHEEESVTKADDELDVEEHQHQHHSYNYYSDRNENRIQDYNFC